MKILVLILFSILSNIAFAQTAPAINELKNAPEEIDGYNEHEFQEWLSEFKVKAHKKYKISGDFFIFQNL